VSDQIILEMRGISKSFPGVHALDDVSFSVRKGEVHALVGENGAGKSTLMKILSGAYTKDQGEILLRGQSVEINGPSHAQALGISIIYQEFTLAPHLTAEQAMTQTQPVTQIPLGASTLRDRIASSQ